MFPVLILAGGLATRLGELTRTTPKCLLPIRGRPFIFWQLDMLERQGISQVIVCTGHLGENIREALAQRYTGNISLHISHEPEPLGTGGAINNAIAKFPKLRTAPFFVLYGDSYIQVNLEDMARTFMLTTNPAMLAVIENHGKWDTSNVWFDNKELRYKKGAKPNSSVAATHIDYGVSILNPNILSAYPGKFDLSSLIQELSHVGKVEPYIATKRFFEIGSKQGIAELELHLASDKASKPALFLDRDGIINNVILRNSEQGQVVSSPRTLDELVFIPEIIELIKTVAAQRTHHIIVVTNQPDIGRKQMDLSVLLAINNMLFELGVTAVYAATSANRLSEWRKPSPRMILEAAKEFDIDLQQSVMIGDSLADVEAAQSAGVKCVAINTHYNQITAHPTNVVVRTHAEASKKVLAIIQKIHGN